MMTKVPETHRELKTMGRGHEMIYRGIRTVCIFNIVKPHPGADDADKTLKETCWAVFQNGLVLSSDDGIDPRVIRTFPAFGEDTSLTF